MRREQALILAGMAGAVIITVVLLSWPHVPSSATPALYVALTCLIAPALCIAAGVGVIANRRFFDATAIDGMDGSPTIDLAQRYLRNTLEQSLLATLTWLVFATVLPDRAAAILPTLAITFVIARASFWIGYAFDPWARAFGFALTFYPTVAILIWSVTAIA